MKIRSRRKVSAPRSAEKTLLWIAGSDAVRLMVACLFAGMLFVAPISSVPVFRVGLSLLVAVAILPLLRKTANRKLLLAGAVIAGAAWAAVWRVLPDTAGFLAIAGWFLIFGGAGLRKHLSGGKGAHLRGAEMLDVAIDVLMLTLGGLLLLRCRTLDYQTLAPYCAVGIVAAAFGTLNITKMIQFFGKRGA